MEQPKKRRRSLAPAALIVAGLAGLGLAAASELDLVWGDSNFQAGAVEVSADCQEGDVTVNFANPEFASGSEVPWTVEHVEFSGISQACHGATYEAAYRMVDDATWVELPAGSGTVSSTVTAPLSGVGDVQDIAEFALTIHGSAASSGN